jgi:hypothetical protein
MAISREVMNEEILLLLHMLVVTCELPVVLYGGPFLTEFCTALGGRICLVCQFLLLLKIQPMTDISLQWKSMGMQCVNFVFWQSFYALIFDIKHL